MDDLISRQAAIDALSCENPTEYWIDYDDAVKAINDIPTAKRPSGEWVEDTYGWVYCSHCKKYLDDYQMVFFLKPFDYCPNCGARMLKGGNDAAD